MSENKQSAEFLNLVCLFVTENKDASWLLDVIRHEGGESDIPQSSQICIMLGKTRWTFLDVASPKMCFAIWMLEHVGVGDTRDGRLRADFGAWDVSKKLLPAELRAVFAPIQGCAGSEESVPVQSANSCGGCWDRQV